LPSRQLQGFLVVTLNTPSDLPRYHGSQMVSAFVCHKLTIFLDRKGGLISYDIIASSDNINKVIMTLNLS